MDKKLIELLERIASDKELAAAFADSLRTGKHLNITGLCAEQNVYVAMALARLNGRKAVFIEPDRILLRGIHRRLRSRPDAVRTVSRER